MVRQARRRYRLAGVFEFSGAVMGNSTCDFTSSRQDLLHYYSSLRLDFFASITGLTNLKFTLSRSPLSVILSSGITDSDVKEKVMCGDWSVEPSIFHASFGS